MTPLFDNGAIPELPPEPGYLAIQKSELNALSRRAAPLAVLLIELIEARTRSARKAYPGGPRPKHAVIPMDDFKAFCGASERTIALHLAELEKDSFIERQRGSQETHRGGYRTLPANYRKKELPQPKTPRHRKRTEPATAHVTAPAQAAAMRAPARPPQPGIEKAAMIGRMVLQSLAEHAALPAVAEIRQALAMAEQAPAQPAAESVLVREIAQAAARTEMQNAGRGLQVGLHGTAEILPPVGATSATCCPYGWLCPVFDGPSEGSPVQKQNQKQDQSVGRSDTAAATDRPTLEPQDHPALPEKDADLDAIAAAIPARLTAKLASVPGRPLLLAIKAELQGTPAEWLERKIYQRWNAIASLGLLIRPDGGLAADARKAYQEWLAKHPARPAPAPDDGALHLEYSQYCYSRAEAMYAQLDPADVAARAAAKTEQLRKDGRLQRLAPDAREKEVRELILRDLEAQIPRYEDWLANRKRE